MESFALLVKQIEAGVGTLRTLKRQIRGQRCREKLTSNIPRVTAHQHHDAVHKQPISSYLKQATFILGCGHPYINYNQPNLKVSSHNVHLLGKGLSFWGILVTLFHSR